MQVAEQRTRLPADHSLTGGADGRILKVIAGTFT
jgi:hypothetical protein